MSDCGIDVGGGRQPDLTIWAKGKPPRRARSSYAGIDGLLLTIEVVAPDSELIDRVIKKGYEPEREPQSMTWLLNASTIDLT